MQRAPKSTRIFIGKLGTLTKQDLFKECGVHGNIIDFLMKEQYAFVVPALPYLFRSTPLWLRRRRLFGILMGSI